MLLGFHFIDTEGYNITPKFNQLYNQKMIFVIWEGLLPYSYLLLLNSLQDHYICVQL